jgi:hypothetical protein
MINRKRVSNPYLSGARITTFLLWASVLALSGCVYRSTNSTSTVQGSASTLPSQDQKAGTDSFLPIQHGIIEVKCITKLRNGVILEVAPASSHGQSPGSRNVDVSGQNIRSRFDDEGFAYIRLPAGKYYLLLPNAIFQLRGVSLYFVDGRGYDLQHLFNVEAGKVCQVELFIPADEHFDGAAR